MVNDALDLYAADDAFAILAYLATQKPEIEVLKACGELATKIYWEKKDLASVVAISLFGLSLGWRIAAHHNAREENLEILGVTKSISYNLASFTWPGWDEADIKIGHTDLVIGLSAAKTNLRLAIELARGKLPLARANWMLGAHYMAQEEYAHADTHFALSAMDATDAGTQAEVLLAEGFQALARLLGVLDQEREALKRISQVKEKLAPLENGSGFVEQLDTAYRVFASRFPFTLT